MRAYDFTPLWRSSIGFDRLFELINSAQVSENEGYPPYDIVRLGDDVYRISLALAGFSPDDITITAQQNLLTVAGRRAQTGERAYLYQGLRRDRSNASSALPTSWKWPALRLRTACCKSISCARSRKP
jgi:molecular chaperone IbpA